MAAQASVWLPARLAYDKSHQPACSPQTCTLHPCPARPLQLHVLISFCSLSAEGVPARLLATSSSPRACRRPLDINNVPLSPTAHALQLYRVPVAAVNLITDSSLVGARTHMRLFRNLFRKLLFCNGGSAPFWLTATSGSDTFSMQVRLLPLGTPQAALDLPVHGLPVPALQALVLVVGALHPPRPDRGRHPAQALWQPSRGVSTGSPFPRHPAGVCLCGGGSCRAVGHWHRARRLVLRGAAAATGVGCREAEAKIALRQWPIRRGLRVGPCIQAC